MPEHFDAVVLGMGPGGEAAAGRLIDGGQRVAVVERELIGGECAYWACIPSKTLLRPPEARHGAERAAGAMKPTLDWADVRDYRDYMVRHLDDSGQSDGYRERGATVVKGVGRIVAPGTVEVGGERLVADHVIVATGSEAKRPDVPGIHSDRVWTNRETTTLVDIPERAVVLGGGPVGIELGQMLARYGARVSLVQQAARLANREDPRVGELMAAALAEDGIDVRLSSGVRSVRDGGGGVQVELDDGATIAADVLVIGAGRTPRTADLGLEALGIEVSPRGLPIDDHCSLGPGLWALGDVTGRMLFTHVAMYQGRIVAANILGSERRAGYRGIPRVIFSDPEIAAVGLTEAQARSEGVEVTTARVGLADAIARPWTYEREPRGELGVVADRNRGVLIGAWAVAPLASEWIQQAALAIRAEVPLITLADGVPQFPTYSEALLAAVEAVLAQGGGGAGT